jgi:Fe-Mn family superoxide dismutase
MPYELPSLPYAYDALEPTIDAQTMEIHHSKHHATYVNNLNAALEGTEWMDRSLEDVFAALDIIPEDKRAAVRNNGGGHANHSLFWETMSPDGGGEPSGALADAIADTFGSVDELKKAINDAGVKRFGSGWTWLIHDGTGLAVAAPRDRRLGARLLPLLPEPPARLPRGVVERRQLGRRRRAPRRGGLSNLSQRTRGAVVDVAGRGEAVRQKI